MFLEPGAVASEVARAAGIHASQLFRWRQQLCGPLQPTPTFAPVAVAPGPELAPALASLATPSVIEIEFATGARIDSTIGNIDSSPYLIGVDRFFDASHSLNFDHRRRPEVLRTAMAIAFFCPTNTTSRLPRVTPV